MDSVERFIEDIQEELNKLVEEGWKVVILINSGKSIKERVRLITKSKSTKGTEKEALIKNDDVFVHT